MNQTHLKDHSPIPRKGIYNNSVKLLLVLSIYCVCSIIIVQIKDFLKNPSEFQKYLIDNIYCVCSFKVQIKDFLKSPSEFQKYLIDNIYCVCLVKFRTKIF